jgi:hypothetical protein
MTFQIKKSQVDGLPTALLTRSKSIVRPYQRTDLLVMLHPHRGGFCISLRSLLFEKSWTIPSQKFAGLLNKLVGDLFVDQKVVVSVSGYQCQFPEEGRVVYRHDAKIQR